MPSIMQDYRAVPNIWTQIPRGTASPVVLQNNGVSEVLVFVGGTMPSPLVNANARVLHPRFDVEMVLLPDDLIFVKSAGDRAVVVNVWYG